MKNKWVLAGLIGLILAFGLISIGCRSLPNGDGNDEGNKIILEDFQGTWKNLVSSSESTFKFTGNEMLFTQNNGTSRPGTFTFTDTEITFIPKQEGTWTGYTQRYTLSGNILTLENDSVHAYGIFTKQ
jgi:hypothetical protein